jgi:crotonobetainyl-CoA:carnitine CoA-transferase CaiB-like acyl-CoA transferase
MKLEGLTVIDLSVFLPGPYLTMTLADHGARVLKIEPPGGDPGREIGPRVDGETVFFRNLNRGKESLVIDLKDPAGRERLLTLCDGADIVVETFRPGVMQRLGVDYETVSARNPGVVYCSISAFGQDGPYRDRPAHDLAVEALGGAISINEGNDGQPAIPGIAAADMLSSLHALSGVLMALLKRKSTGRGDYVDISMHDAVLAAYPNVVGPVFAHGRDPVPKHERSMGGSAFYRIYETVDGRHVVLGGQEAKFVRNLLTALERPELAAHCEAGPGPHQAPVVAFLSETFARRSQAEWIDWFAGRDICFAPVKRISEAFDDSHARHRGMVLGDGASRQIGPPIKFRHEPARPRLAVPHLEVAGQEQKATTNGGVAP